MLGPDQQQELLDNVVEEFTYRLRQGNRPSIAEFTDRYPSLSSEIEELLTSVAMIEELKTQSNTITDSIKKEMKQITQLERIGDYRIIRELGRGGMGVVFEAIHESLGRRVAIKVMPNRKFDDQKYLERFRREAQAAANLHHTNIVSVFGLGQTGEHHYYVMEFVDGESLAGILQRLNQFYESNTKDGFSAETMPTADAMTSDDGQDFLVGESAPPISLRKFNSPKQRYRWAAQIGAQLADGLAYAHGLGMLHRDVKPANLLIDKHETVWLTDFGLVKNISNQSITKTGDIIGTPQYMAPESFEGEYDKRSETYCLGLTLYEMVTLRPAYENASTPELIRRITTTSPVSPRKLDQHIPRDLNRIIEKSVSREPGYRYQSAAEMREDLRAFLDDRPISARKISLAENMWRWSRRNPVQAFLSFFSVFMLFSIATVATIALDQNRRLTNQIRQRLDSTDVQVRATKSALGLAEEAIDVTVQFYDKLFKSIVFQDADVGNDFALDGFGDLEGVSATIKESDAELLDKMMQFYLSFANNEKNQTNLQLKSLAALCHRRVANIYHLTGQFEKAVDSYQTAIETYDAVRHSSPSELTPVLNLVRVINECGKAYELKGSFSDRKKADDQFARSIEILRERLNFGGGEADNTRNKKRIQSELVKSLLLKGTPTIQYSFNVPQQFTEVKQWMPNNWFGNRGRVVRNNVLSFRISEPKKSQKEIEEALAITSELEADYLQQQSNRLNDAIRLYFDSRWQFLYWRWGRASSLEHTAFFNLYNFLANFEQNEDLRFTKAVGLTRLGTIELVNREISEGRRTLRSATKLMNDLVESDRGNPEYKFLLAQIRSIGNLRAFNSRDPSFRDIEQSIAKSLEISKEIMIGLVAEYDNNLDYRRMLGEVCFRLGVLKSKLGRSKDAIRNLEMAMDMYTLLMPQTPRSREIQARGLNCLMHYAAALMEAGEYDEAIMSIRKVIDDDKEGLFAGHIPRNAKRVRQAILYRILYVTYTEAKDSTNAYRAWKKAMEFYSQVGRFRQQISRPRLPGSPN